MSKAPIQFFQEYLSGIDGDRCPMTPNCSTYCLTAIEKHGALLGYMMCADRLMRCGRDEVHIGKKLWSNGRFRTYDPVENNDFWWDQEARRPDGS